MATFLVSFEFMSLAKAGVPVQAAEIDVFTNWIDEDALRMQAQLETEKPQGELADGVLYAPTPGAGDANKTGHVTTATAEQEEMEFWQPAPEMRRLYGTKKSPWIQGGEKLSAAEKALLDGDINAYLDFDTDNQLIAAKPVYGETLGNNQNVNVYPITVDHQSDFDDLWNEREEASDWTSSDKNTLNINETAETSVLSTSKSTVAPGNSILDFLNDVDQQDSSMDWLFGTRETDFPKPEASGTTASPDSGAKVETEKIVVPSINPAVAVNNVKDPIATPADKGRFVDGVTISTSEELVYPATATIKPVNSLTDVDNKNNSESPYFIRQDMAGKEGLVKNLPLEIEPIPTDVSVSRESSTPLLVPQPKLPTQPVLVSMEKASNLNLRAGVSEEQLPFGEDEGSVYEQRNSHYAQKANSYGGHSLTSEMVESGKINSEKVEDTSNRAASGSLDNVIVPVGEVRNMGRSVAGLRAQIGFVFPHGSTNISLDGIREFKVFASRAVLEGKVNADVILANTALKLQSLRFAIIRAILERGGFKSENIRPLLADSNPDEVIVKVYSQKR